MAHDHSNAVEGGEVPLASLGSYARGSIPRGGAADWEAHDASTDGAALAGDGTDVVSTLTPTWKGSHTHEANIILADGVSIGQAAGPTITFDDTGDFLEITGCMVSFGHTMPKVMIDINSADPNKNGILLGSGTPPPHLGMIKFTGADFFGFTPSGWLSLTASGTAGGGGVGNHNLLSIVHPDTVPNAALRGFIIRGDNLDRWDRYDASTDGAALHGDGNDIISTLTPTWKGAHTHEANIVLDDGVGDSPMIELASVSASCYIYGLDNAPTCHTAVKLADNAGVSYFIVMDDLGNSVWGVDSDGNVVFDNPPSWMGLGAAAGRFVFNSVPNPDQILVHDADFHLQGNKIIIDNTDDDTYFISDADDVVKLYIAGALDFSFTANAFNVLAGSAIVMGNDTTIGQAAGPLLTFDDANNDLEITGCGVHIGIGATAFGNLFSVSQANIGATNVFTFGNPDGTNVASHSRVKISTGGAGGGDGYIQFTNSVSNWVFGFDNSDAFKFKIANWFQFDGTNERFVMTTTGRVGIGASPASRMLEIHAALPAIRLMDTDIPAYAELGGFNGSVYLRADAGNDQADSRMFFEIDGGLKATILADGKVGFGLAVPQRRLHLHEASSGAAYEVFTNTTTGEASGFFIGLASNEAAILWHQDNYQMDFGTNNALRVRILNSGQVYMYALDADTGTSLVLTAGDEVVTDSSSLRFKENVEDLVVDLDKLYQLHPIGFNWKKSGTPDLGLAAEEVYKVLPELVILDRDGKPFSVKYGRLAVLLLSELQRIKEERK